MMQKIKNNLAIIILCIMWIISGIDLLNIRFTNIYINGLNTVILTFSAFSLLLLGGLGMYEVFKKK